MNNNLDFLFLMGGHDLEMMEIKMLLDKYKNNPNPSFIIDYVDNDLQWGAKLSSYSKNISKPNTTKIVEIELDEDIPLPLNYISIDHHNKKSDLPSSIEQVAHLLNLPLSRHQLLVGINDSSYIPGLVDYGASIKEIAAIRQADRRAQGVTKADERLAKLAVKSGVNFGDLFIVYYNYARFSPVTDIVKAAQLIVWNEKTLNYYGHKTALLTEHFHTLISGKKAYSGGKPLSFFGLDQKCFNESEIEKIKDEIIMIVKN